MKACPWCGRNNLDSDEYCFNCERNLNAVPDEEEVEELQQEMQRIRVYKPPSLFRLIVISLVRKAIFSLLALGAFFIFALIAIWVSYDNSTLAACALAVLGAALLVALYYPDIKLSRRVGTRGVPVSMISNIVLLILLAPPVLWFLDNRGYIAGIWDFMGKSWWAFLAFPVLGMLLAWLAGRNAYAETATP